MRQDNPVRGVLRYADNKCDRRLSEREYKQLGDALRMADPTIWPAAVAATRFLAVTGWRSGEALGLQWTNLDLPRRTATLPDTKTGKSIRPLSKAACNVLKGIQQSDRLAFPATRGNGQMNGYAKLFQRIAKLESLPKDITPHVLRHSFASLAADLGYSESTIAALIGHQGRSVTSRYTHAADAVLLAAADSVAEATLRLMGAGHE
jgi:integrase